MSHDELYVRYNAREVVAHSDPASCLDVDEQDAAMRAQIVASLIAACDMENALDRRSALETAAALELHELRPRASALLADSDSDVVVAAAACLAACATNGVATQDVEAIEGAMRGAYYPETRRALAVSLAELGSDAGVPELLTGLDLHDDLLREDSFESFFQVTGKHEGYDPLAPRYLRLAAIARLRAWWAQSGGPDALRRVERVPAALDDRAWQLVELLADGRADDEETMSELMDLGAVAVPALVRGLKYPAGFAARRQWICKALRQIGNTDAAPALVAALRDPVVQTAHWACLALQTTGDPAVLEALGHYRDRLLTLNATGRIPAQLDFADLLAEADRAIELFQ
jgi:HEAT repeat protein